tara:strand:+ start:532 stop:822 length:291 start_codon:yes stop_codon:yes gene_type:complete
MVEYKKKLSICCGADEHQYIKSFCSACKEATSFESDCNCCVELSTSSEPTLLLASIEGEVGQQAITEAKVYAMIRKQLPDVSDEWLQTHIEVVVSQ